MAAFVYLGLAALYAACAASAVLAGRRLSGSFGARAAARGDEPEYNIDPPPRLRPRPDPLAAWQRPQTPHLRADGIALLG